VSPPALPQTALALTALSQILMLAALPLTALSLPMP
jgi:hypothetical protein